MRSQQLFRHGRSRQWFLGLAGVLSAQSAWAQVAEQADKTAAPLKQTASLPGLGQIVISLALVVAAIVLLAFLYKKLQLKMPGSKHFKVIATLPVGQKERLLVIEIQGKQRVIGVTPHSVNFLFELENSLPEEKLASDFHTQLQSFLKK
ncbi:flagellar biosynthetic protein FliO [Rheinheimera tilapiae]|uniref:Flagellar protein n=1 Tax=Rheinheimera tilapiae TaxID=875043 RepID=A0ABV6BH14_9GAMM